MITDPEQPDDLPDHLPNDADEAQLTWLLTSAYSGPAVRAEFSRELASRLDAEFAKLGALESNGHASNGHAKNGHAKNGTALEPHLTNGHAEAAEQEPVVVATRGSSLRRRWIVGVATAASLLMAMAVWADPPAWANMVWAIVTTIERFTVGGGGGDGAPAAPAVIDGGEQPSEEAANNPNVGGGIEEPVVEEQPGAALGTKTIAEEVRTLGPPPVERIASSASVPPPTAAKEAAPKPEQPQWKAYAEPLEPQELTHRVNEQLSALWTTQRVQPAGPANDAGFMRRAYLDLLGRVPTVSEAREFLDDKSSDLTPAERRAALVDRLLAHHDHATHFAAVWRRVLLPDEVDLSRLGGSQAFEEWLAGKFAANVPYDQIVSELLLAQGRVSESGPLLFYAAVRLNPEELAARTSRAFLGVRMECAQCHDHPFDDKISQQDFWSFAAFFARISRPRGKMEMTSPVLAVRDNARGEVMIPESDQVVPPRLPGSVMDLAEQAESPSRREQLVRWLTDRDNQHFAQATVNRVWAHLFGRGLVEPVDDMRPANPAIAPEVLDTLSRDFAASGFDLRRLVRALVLTDAYQMASREDTSDKGAGDPSRGLVFAAMNVKSLTAEQLYDSITVATGKVALGGRTMGPQTGLMRYDDMSRQSFIEQFRTAPGQATDYQAGIPQALTLMHGGLIHGATDVAASGLLKSLAAPFFTDDQRLETLYLATLSRYPDDDERAVLVAEMKQATNTAERQQVLGDVLWALLNSAEFTLNH